MERISKHQTNYTKTLLYGEHNMSNLKQTIIIRDNLTSEQADRQIAAAITELNQHLNHGDEEAASEVCLDHFGLEPDFLLDLL